MAETVQADVLVLGDGLAAWAAVREVARHGRSSAVITCEVAARRARPVVRHRPVGPWPSYVGAVQRLGRDAARSLWEAFREDGDALTRLAGELALPDAVGHRGGFVLARTREEALDLGEGEDLLREDAFSGEFLDNYMLEARFDVRGLLAAYWAVDDLTLDEGVLVAALRTECSATRRLEGPLLSLDTSRGVAAATAHTRVEAGCLVVATRTPLGDDVPTPGFREETWSSAVHRPRTAAALPCPARSWDGRVLWEQGESGLLRLSVPGDVEAPLDWVEDGVPEAVLHEGGTTPVSIDGLPVLGSRGAPVFLLRSGQAATSACAVAGARWVIEAALAGRDEIPPLLHASRFARPDASG